MSAHGRLAAALASRYRIDRELGQGGMATVFLAEDLRHEREVAIKVLHPDLGATLGTDRFLSEIRTTARLQHPHILPLLDSGEADGLLYYVMPRVMGETLRARLDRERQLPIEDAVRIAREVADALDYAHGHGIIHRDVKPENILLEGGHARVADFGIALAVQQAAGARLTETGLSLGTPQYMSPEQAMGERHVDARSDVYALGAVTYEMLTGDPPFTGSTVQAIVAKIMTEKPTPVHAVRDTVPAHIEHAIHTALAKLPADRQASAARFRDSLERPAAAAPPETRAVSATALPPAAARPPRTAAALAVMGLVTVASLGVAAWALFRPEPAPGPSRFVISFEEGHFEDAQEAPVISPDDRTIVLATTRPNLVLRHESRFEPTFIPGTGNAWSPFYSPDGMSIGYVQGFPGDLRVVDLRTSAIRTIVPDSAVSYGASWTEEGWIYFVSSFGRALLRVRADGGSPELVARVDSARGDMVYRFPHVLPRARALLLTRIPRQGPAEIVHLDLESRQLRPLSNGLRAWYVESGHLVIARGDGTIVAMRFDPRDGEIESRAVEIVRGFRVAIGAVPVVAVSNRGTIAYDRADGDFRVVRVSRTGDTLPTDPSLRGQFRSVTLSPDGSRAAISVMVDGRLEVWVKALPDGPFTRVAAAGTHAYRPFWSNDGRRIGFNTDITGLSRLFVTDAEGGGTIEPLPGAGSSVDEGYWSGDGRWLLVRAGSGGGRDIYGIRLDGDPAPVPLAASAEEEEYSPIASPDGRWLAYGADGSGQDEIFVRALRPGSDRRFQVSVAGGTEPVWSRSGRELFYRDLDQNLVAAAVAPGDEFRILSRRILFSAKNYLDEIRNRAYDVSADDQSFYFLERSTAESGGLVMVRNWVGEAEARLTAE